MKKKEKLIAVRGISIECVRYQGRREGGTKNHAGDRIKGTPPEEVIRDAR
jgi:hypothetical protein